MEKEKRVVVRQYNRHAENQWIVLGKAETIEEANQVFAAEGEWERGDGRGAVAFLLPVVIDGDDFFIPANIDFEEPFNNEKAPY